MITGFATAEGTARYRERFAQLRDVGHFRRPEHVPGAGKLWLSSLGLGTYLGEPDEATDRAYTEAVLTALGCGINVLDTAINYRHQRSERSIGTALEQLINAGELQRDEVVVCTKAGFLSFDGELPANPRDYFHREYLQPEIMQASDVAGGMHCMAPRYLADQLERSRKNLQLETIDVFYIHNPETQLSAVDRTMFHHRLRAAFSALEDAVEMDKIRYYGLATWNGFRLSLGERDYLSLSDVVRLARDIAGDGHHLRFLQLPFNLAMPEAFGLGNQDGLSGDQPHEPALTLFEAAREAGIAVVGSATLYQGQLTHGLPEFIGQRLGGSSDSENAIQFARSAPGLTTALIGMSRREHVAANLKAALRPLASVEQWTSLFSEE